MATDLHRFETLYDHAWDVRVFGEWVLVADTATRYWMRLEDVPAFVAEWDRLAELDPEDEDRNRYSGACQAADGFHDDVVPNAIVTEARSDLDVAAADSVSRGW